MSSTIRGDTLAAKMLIRYGDGSYNADGTASASVFYAVLTSALIGNLPTVGTTSHPLFGAGWKCSGYRWARAAPGVSVLEIIFTASISVSSAQIEQEFDNIAEIEPITSHPLFTSTLAGTASAPLNGAVWIDKNGVAYGQPGYDSASGRFSYFGPGSFFGQESYLLPKATYRYSYNATSVPTAADVGTIVSAPTGSPSLPTGCTWLLTGRTWRRQGSIYRISETYMGSGPNGWNTTIYT